MGCFRAEAAHRIRANIRVNWGRYTMRADPSAPSIRGWQRCELLDCEMDWMSKERFALSDFSQMPANAARPERLLCQRWLVDYDIRQPGEDDRRVIRRERQTRWRM